MTTRPTPPLHDADDGGGLPVSARIRSRLINARQRYHANDNISAYVMDGEVDALRDEVESKMAEVLKSLVIDTEGDHNTQETARRGNLWGIVGMVLAVAATIAVLFIPNEQAPPASGLAVSVLGGVMVVVGVSIADVIDGRLDRLITLRGRAVP